MESIGSKKVRQVLKPIIVGQAPSCTSDPDEPLSGKSGGRLAELCGLTMPEFLDRFDRINLQPNWLGRLERGDRYLSVHEARAKAQLLRAAFADRRIVVLGAINATAFGIRWSKLYFRRHWNGEFAWCPHPSGLTRFWNDPVNVALARHFWTALAKGSDLG